MTQPDTQPTSPAAAATRLDVRAASASYVVEIGSGISRQLDATMTALNLPTRRFVVSNPTVWGLHGEALAALTAPLGAALAHRLEQQTLRYLFAAFLVIVGISMIWKAFVA